MKRYMFVKNALTKVRASAASYVAPKKCPWNWVETDDNNRYPRKIANATCGTNCDKWYCVPVRYKMLVFKKTQKRNEWVPQMQIFNVAFVYNKQSI